MKRFLIAVYICVATSAHAQMPPSPGHLMRMLSVSGEAKMEVSPDQAILNISLVSRNLELTAAKRANDKLSKTVTNIALDMNIPKKNITTSHLYVSPEYDYQGNRQHLKGYRVNRSLRITMESLDKYERLLSEVIAAGVDQVDGVEFRISKPEIYEQKLRAQAVKNAASKARVLAEAAGMRLGKPISISTGLAPMISYPPLMPRAEDAMMMSALLPPPVAPTLPGMIQLQQSISVVYEME